ncbi:MAG: DUF3662 domain-containing protein [Selenomonadaceae bacterium]|nr:DUF3662 domain-containing protein [Selenomonadaceae bacterium]
MGIAKIESFLTNRIEGFFNNRFHGDLEPVELFQSLEREILLKSKKVTGELIAPNDFTFFLEESDYGRLSSKRVIDALYEIAERKVIKNDSFMDKDLKIRLQKDKTLEAGEFKLQACFTENNDVESDAEEPHTIVLERSKFDVPLNLPNNPSLASLIVTEGNNEGATFELTDKMLYIGRREKSDITLSDDKISRLHAYITYERHRHYLIDAGSLNGSYVNDDRIDKAYIKDGDVIRLGETLLLYEVM